MTGSNYQQQRPMRLLDQDKYIPASQPDKQIKQKVRTPHAIGRQRTAATRAVMSL